VAAQWEKKAGDVKARKGGFTGQDLDGDFGALLKGGDRETKKDYS